MSAAVDAARLQLGRRVEQLAEEMVELGLASTRDEALDMILEQGAREAERLVRRRRRVAALLERYRREGLPVPPERLPTHLDVEEERRARG